MPYILSTFSRTDVSLGGPAIHVAGTGASRSPSRRIGHPTAIVELQVDSGLFESIACILVLYSSRV
uniref:Uncharacterized protein n=1 Tax=Solanum tuberosum TaxID=4113 RepID=M1A3F2_SOLTU